ncbi:glutathione S-transferase [Acinetobacter wanghuae]|uniref:glutathione transferase n=1 Tax=Acinetobacter wanghuae TaxID=2662362 RepID=A0A5Q0P5Z4_9GAMM|nr:glutathione S-transferase [Acinetobacter wanghuae]MQW93407.1 glutathione S-transferase [Acinetobacter wanghuae]QGA12154.1 glutathione S-transferase [Acinetobacter wanghuae]
MRVLHHLEQSRSFRILWALEELELDYDIQLYKRLPNFSAPPSLKQVHPLGKAPVLVDQDQVLAESAVILEYLQESYDKNLLFQPLNATSKQQFRYWMHYAEGSLMPLLVMHLVMDKVATQAPFLVKPIAKQVAKGVQAQFVQPRLKDHIDYLEGYLTQHEYFAGRFSFADIQMSFPLEALQSRLKNKYPAINAYLDRLGHRAAYFRAKSKEQNLK